jgi:hypothetical protein
MAKLKDKIRTGLDEDRMLVLVVQVLIGFQFRGVFEAGFEKLSPEVQYLKMVAFGLLLLALALLMTVPAYHRLAERGDDTARVARVLTSIMSLALLPFALALGVDLAVVCNKLFGFAGGITGGCAAAGAALFFWYGLEMIARKNRNGSENNMNNDEEGHVSVADKIKQILTEGRIILPGAQALLGFQLSGFFTDAFEKLPRQSQILHLVALSFVALTAILLMTPPAYHRIVEKGEETERFEKVANRFVISAMIPLALGVVVDFYVVLNKVTHAPGVSLGISAAVLALFYGLWFVYPLLARNGHHPQLITSPTQ